nr:FAD-dependent monooxygenase [Streptomyces europaeiscabiei]
MEKTEVVVVGSGPTGLLLAGELALAGVYVVVLDKLPERRAQAKALNLQPRTAEVLDLRGLLDDAHALLPEQQTRPRRRSPTGAGCAVRTRRPVHPRLPAPGRPPAEPGPASPATPHRRTEQAVPRRRGGAGMPVAAHGSRLRSRQPADRPGKTVGSRGAPCPQRGRLPAGPHLAVGGGTAPGTVPASRRRALLGG